MTSRRAYFAIAVTAMVGLIPPMLVYMQGRAELHAKYSHTNAEAEAGYAALVESVRELRVTVKAQSETIGRLQGHIEFIEKVMQQGLRITSVRPLPPVMKPAFVELPSDLGDARAAQTMPVNDVLKHLQAK